MFNALFLKDLAERAIATAAQVLLGFLTADGFNLISASWSAIGVAVATAVLIVIVKSVIAANVSSTVSPASLAPEGKDVV